MKTTQIYFNKHNKRNVFYSRHNTSKLIIIESKDKPAKNLTNIPFRPSFKLSKTNNQNNFLPNLYKCYERDSNLCINKTADYRKLIINEFKRIINDKYDDTNIYYVNYTRKILNNTSPQCLIMNSGINVLKKNEEKLLNVFIDNYLFINNNNSETIIFNNSEYNNNNNYNNKKNKNLFHFKFKKEKFSSNQTCVIVSSAGSILNSSLGNFIDSHDIVVRFNHAPIEGYETDVGSKTTIRIVNSQVISKIEYNFLYNKLFQNITIIGWDPGKYNITTLHDWFIKPDYNLFVNYKKFRNLYHNYNIYLINPKKLWQLWELLHDYTRIKIYKNPPTSGFIGIGLLLPYCNYIDVIEYIPSTRFNGLCHYYDNEINSACTFGSWHPLSAEKLMAIDMNNGDDFSLYQSGILRIYQPNNC